MGSVGHGHDHDHGHGHDDCGYRGVRWYFCC
jgi:hypothetical protein